jgi:hypothetical protein
MMVFRRTTSARVWTLWAFGLWVFAASVVWSCLSAPLEVPSPKNFYSADIGVSSDDGQAPGVLGLFTLSGCAKLTFPSDEPRCEGVAPLAIQLVLLPVGVSSFRWQVFPTSTPSDGGTTDGGTGSLLTDAQSKSRSPQITLQKPGDYWVSLAVSGPGGTSNHTGHIVVSAGEVGAPCRENGQCKKDLFCLCGADTPGKDGACPGSLANGLCTRTCDGVACPSGSVCLNLSRSQATIADGGTPDSFRQPICVPPCENDKDCRDDHLCRVQPLSQPGAPASAPLVFGKACFAAVLSNIGDRCMGADEQPSPSACATGICEPLGARHLCTHVCGVCPEQAACAAWNGSTPPVPSGQRCLARCDATHPCADPLLDCLPGGGPGGLGFTLPTEPPPTQVCAPRRCTKAADCPTGRCVAVSAASFCLRN